MAETIEESVRLVVEEEERKGRNGKYSVKIVRYKGKVWTVGKKETDKVDVGGKYEFKLVKNEYNDQIYYWANLAETDDDGDETPNKSKPSDFDKVKKDFIKYFESQSLEKQKQILGVLLEKLG